VRTLARIGIALASSACIIALPVSPKVRGVVRECASHRPVGGARITLTHHQLDRRKSAVSDAEGHFELGRIWIVTPIPFAAIRLQSELEVAADGYAPARSEVAGDETVEQTIELCPAYP
jgi:hypothetical protein